MRKRTVRIEGADLSALTTAMEVRLKGYFEYFYNDTFVFVNENYFMRSNENLMSVIIVFLVGAGRGEVDVISGGGSGVAAGWGAEDSSNAGVVEMLREICSANKWSLLEDQAK